MVSKVELIHGDCLKIIKNLPHDSVDMVLTDPPYLLHGGAGGGIGRNRNFLKELADSDLQGGFAVDLFLESLFGLFRHKECFNGVFFCSIKQVADYLNFAKSHGLQYGLGVWHKTNPPPLCNNKYLGDIEYWIYIKGKRARLGGEFGDKSMVYRSPINITDKKRYKHATIKPVPMLEKFLNVHTNSDDLVFDPFMGSGSTGVACLNSGRRFIGIEINETYFQTASKRLSDYEIGNPA